jgi:hypothetical protein
MNMFKPVEAKSSKEYISMLSQERQQQIVFLDKLIRKACPSLRARFSSNMLGYGSFSYKGSNGKVGEWPIISLASQKNYISIYVCAIEGREYLAEKYKKDLGKVSVGKSCIRIKKIEDLNLEVLKKVLQLAAKSPGLVIKE